MERTTKPSSGEEKEGPGDGNVYGAFIADQFAVERAVKDSVERRAAGVITTSGVLVTLLFGLTALTTKSSSYVLPSSAHKPLFVALAAFVVAFALAITASIPFWYRTADASDLERIRREKWRDRDWVARRRVAGTEIILIKSYRRANAVKAGLLGGAGAAQLIALIALGITIAAILRSSPASHRPSLPVPVRTPGTTTSH